MTSNTGIFLLHVTYLFGFFPGVFGGSGMPDWSIALEMQYYFAFPFLALLLRKRGWLPLILISTAGSLLFHSLWSVYYMNPAKAFGNFSQPTLLPFKLPIFLLGGILADSQLWKLKPRFAISMIALNLTGVVFPIPLISTNKPTTAVYVLCVVLFLLWRSKYTFRFQLFSIADRYLASGWLRWTGDVSYPVYLIHPAVFLLVSALLGKTALWPDSPPACRLASLLLISIPLIYAISWLIHIYFELPFIQFGKRITRIFFPDDRVRA